MDDNASPPANDGATTALRHTPVAASLSLAGNRSSIVARGRREAAGAATNPHFQQAARDFNAARFRAAAAGFALAAAQGHAESQYLLSTMLDEGLGIAPDSALAESWERRAAAQGHAHAQANLSFRCYTAGDLGEAFLWCERAAHSRLAWAQYHLGLMYRKGEGVPPSDTQAALWYRLAATQGFADAQVRLADLLYLGQGVTQSDTEAAAWYRKAAEQGHPEAQFQLAHLYAIGRGVDHDYTQSRHWIRQAALQGHEAATRELLRREYRDP